MMGQYLAFETLPNKLTRGKLLGLTDIVLYVVKPLALPLVYSKPQGADKLTRGKLLGLPMFRQFR